MLGVYRLTSFEGAPYNVDLNNCAKQAAPLLTTCKCLAHTVAQVQDAVLSFAQSTDTYAVEHGVLYYHISRHSQVTRVLTYEKGATPLEDRDSNALTLWRSQLPALQSACLVC